MKPIRVSPFALTYDMEAIIPIEIRVLTLQKEIPEKVNIEANAKDLNMADELREVATVRIVSYQVRVTYLYNRRVRQRAFQARDLVLRRVFENTADLVADKF